MFFLDYILSLSRTYKRLIALFLDMLFISTAYWMSLIVRLDSTDVLSKKPYWVLLAIVLPLTILAFIKLGLYRAVLRYMHSKAVLTIILGISVSVIVLVSSSFFLRYSIPRTVPFIFFSFLLILSGGSRLTVRSIASYSFRSRRERVVIYGSGEAGRELASVLIHGGDYNPIAFIDDDDTLHGNFIYGRPVYSFDRLSGLIKDASVKRVLLALTSANSADRSKVLSKLESLAVEVLSIPKASDLINGDAKIDELREVAIEDLLGRDSVVSDPSLMSKNIRNKIVLVTGAGGSIGSELCRQIILQEPDKVILFDVSEFALYNIDTELKLLAEKNNLKVVVLPLMGNIQNKDNILNVLRYFKVDTVYHAAAYKHVPLVEYNVVEGVRNNILGTYNVASASAEAKVSNFVLISTDKAVRPTNIMGATKRVAELCLQALASSQDSTLFCMVRFGNVLNSSGSVIPVFREQIKKGGPVTVTHKDIVRYFMTIPEASQLVIQAGAMAKGGDVFLLDMGEAVRIYDLAVKMIHLMGLEVETESAKGDIEITYTGLRPGEKLYEELLIDEKSISTSHPGIMKAQEKFLDIKDIEVMIARFKSDCKKRDVKSIYKSLKKLPIEFQPNSHLCDLQVNTAELSEIKDGNIIWPAKAQG